MRRSVSTAPATSRSSLLLTIIGLLLLVALGKLALDTTGVSAAQTDAIAGASSTNACAASGLVPVGDTGLCTHGPDSGSTTVDQDAADATVGAAAVVPPIDCVGDGSSGNRVEVLYVRTADVASRVGYQATVRGVAARANQIFRDGAAETGGSRSIRFVHSGSTGGGCAITVTEVVVSRAARASFAATITEVTAQGFNRTDRKYLMFMEADALCGVGTVVPDDRRDSSNRNNFGPSYSRVDVACWTPDLAAHELMHNLGGVQDTAPNASLGGHCVDERDIMCYSDTPNYPAMRVDCADPAGDTHQLDCNHDDYYNTNPPASSYLATRWNSANNQFLVGSVAQTALPAPANDDIDRAIVAGTRAFTDAGAIVSSATAATDDPRSRCTPYSQSATVWYATTPTTDRTLTLDTLGSRYRTVLSVWSGSRGNLSEVACDMREGTNTPARVEFAAKAGTTYYVMVGSFYTPGANELTLSLTGKAAEVVPAALVLSKDKSKYNGPVTAALTGFAPNASVTLHWPRAFELTGGASKGQSTTLLASGTTDAAGNVTLGFRTPLEPLGDYALTARDEAGVTATATLRVIPRILLNEVAGSTSTKLRVYFYGFAAGERIEVRWHANGAATSSFSVIKVVTVAGNGRASALVTIPGNTATSTHAVVGKVVGVSRSASTAFQVTSRSVAARSVDDETPTRTASPTATPEGSATATPTATETPAIDTTETVTPAETVAPEPTATPESIATVEPVAETPTPEATPAPDAIPVADAGTDQTIVDADGSGDEPVVIDGVRSTDPEGLPLTYAWSVAGTVLSIDATATLTLPVGTTTVLLTVTDATGQTATDEIVVTVEPTPMDEVAATSVADE